MKMTDLKKINLSQIDNVVKQITNDMAGIALDEISPMISSRFITSMLAVIECVAGSKSIYMQQAQEVLRLPITLEYKIQQLIGILASLHDDVAKGYLTDVREIIHGELFSDVIAGGVLESHLRQLCIKHDIEVVTGPDEKTKMAGQMNDDLARKKVYNVLDQKSITEYTKDQVSLMLQGLRNFIARFPA
jgi:hypothetical protein